jgi:hypothetical protein
MKSTDLKPGDVVTRKAWRSTAVVKSISGTTVSLKFAMKSADCTQEIGWVLVSRAGDAPITADAPVTPKKARPHGPQEYKGNGNHEWERVATNVMRLRVPGGWVYKDLGAGIVFVPTPEVVGYAI